MLSQAPTTKPTSPAAPTINYTATDPLGSPRVLTNKQGEVISRRDFMPFGEEIAPGAETHQTAADKYGVGDGVRQKFTGYERDEETGFDFAEARYYYNNHGRFTAVDPLLASGKSANPQTFNRYAYTMNRPLIFTDPSGLQTGAPIEEEQYDGPVPQIRTTTSCGLGCQFKKGFNYFVRSIIGKDNWYEDEDLAMEERKRSDFDKEVGNAIKNYGENLNTVTNAVVDADPTGILNAQKVVTENGLGRASDSDVARAITGAAVNTAMTVAPSGKLGKALPALDDTGKVHGALPKIKDIVNYTKEELEIFLGDLRKSVQRRIEVTTKLGREKKHAERQGQEQKLIRAIERYLNR